MHPSDAALLWSHLHVLTKERYDALLQVYDSLGDAADHLGEELLRGLGCRNETALKSLARMEEFDPAKYAAELRKRGIRFLEIRDDDYPARLKQIGDPPPFLYARGDLSVLEQPCVGVVGTRAMTPYGRRVTEEFVPAFVRAGVVTVSGLAEGIDAHAAEETLREGGRTVAALGHGLGMIFPAHHADLAERIVERGGLLLSEFPLDFPPDKYTFPARNRIIAGVSLATVVLEAPEGSGALITADLALDYGREVFAVPGEIFDPHYAGCHQFIARGRAGLASRPADVLRALGIVAPEEGERSSYVPLPGSDEETVFAVLTTMPQDIDRLAERSGLEAGRLNAALTILELGGGAKHAGGGQWVRS